MRQAIAFLLCLAAFSQDRHVVLISLDGYPSYALRDPQTPAPTLRRLIREGAWAPAGMLAVNPTVTWPNHTAMVTGVDAARHEVIYNGMPVRQNGKVRVEPFVPKVTLVKAPTVYDLAHAAGLKTAEIDWVAVEDAPTINWSFGEIPRADSPVVKEMITAGLVTAENIAAFRSAPITFRDEVWTQAAIHILKAHRPNLLLFHLLTTDSSQHSYGARSLGATSALALADRQVERLIDAVRESGLLEKTTFLIVSDHGFLTVKREIRPAVLVKSAEVTVISEGGTAMIYGSVDPGLFRGIEGITDIITPDRYKEFGYPALQAGGRMADLVLAAGEGYSFSASATAPVVTDVPAGRTPGSHGYLNTLPGMRSIFVAWGAGVRPQVTVDGVRAVDIAPTIARLLGLQMNGVLGIPIAGALK